MFKPRQISLDMFDGRTHFVRLKPWGKWIVIFDCDCNRDIERWPNRDVQHFAKQVLDRIENPIDTEEQKSLATIWDGEEGPDLPTK